MTAEDSDGPGNPFDALRERQREILRLIPWHPNSAAIARIVNSSPAAVDKQIKLAMRTLGVHSRQDAARRLIEHENGGVQRSDPLKPDLPARPSWPLPLPIPTAERPKNDLTPVQILEVAIAIAIAVPLLILAGASLLEEASRIAQHLL